MENKVPGDLLYPMSSVQDYIEFLSLLLTQHQPHNKSSLDSEQQKQQHPAESQNGPLAH